MSDAVARFHGQVARFEHANAGVRRRALSNASSKLAMGLVEVGAVAAHDAAAKLLGLLDCEAATDDDGGAALREGMRLLVQLVE